MVEFQASQTIHFRKPRFNAAHSALYADIVLHALYARKAYEDQQIALAQRVSERHVQLGALPQQILQTDRFSDPDPQPTDRLRP